MSSFFIEKYIMSFLFCKGFPGIPQSIRTTFFPEFLKQLL